MWLRPRLFIDPPIPLDVVLYNPIYSAYERDTDEKLKPFTSDPSVGQLNITWKLPDDHYVTGYFVYHEIRNLPNEQFREINATQTWVIVSYHCYGATVRAWIHSLTGGLSSQRSNKSEWFQTGGKLD